MKRYNAARQYEAEPREREHADLIRSIAPECMVLLKNNGVLPIKPSKLALFGNGARRTVKGGTGSGDVNTRNNVNIEQGLKEAGIEIVSGSWLDRQDAWVEKKLREYYAMIDRIAKEKGASPVLVTFDYPYKEAAPVSIMPEDCHKADAAVYVISRNSGEGSDRNNERGDYLLYREDIDNLKILADHYEKTIVVLNIGGVMDMTELDQTEGVGAILLMTQLGNLGGNALADVITGKAAPSGKTTDTWARAYSDYPSSAEFSHYGSIHDEDYSDDIFVGYRYFDSFGVAPEYPFGYGLSYTSFCYEAGEVTVSGDRVSVPVTVQNTGEIYSGKEVIQVYVSVPQKSIPQPYQVLAAFTKTKELEPGEKQTVVIEFSLKEIVSYCEADAAWILDEGDYIIRAGQSSRDTQAVAVLRLPSKVTVRQCRNAMPLDRPLAVISPDKAVLADRLSVECGKRTPIMVDPGAFETETVVYQEERKEFTTDKTQILTMSDVMEGRCTVEELTAQLTIDELAELCVGTLRAEQGSIVGNASATVPGAAGDTSSILAEKRGVKGIIMADGPAGLRLTPHFKTDLEGNLLPGGDTLGGITEGFDSSYDETNSIDYYQYCTAIPIGWGLAQSWNTQMVENIGRMVGSEMERFGVDLWLAPALNIHRNPLCGRNFEYYSEDPLVSGRIAAAMVRGVESCKGKGTTIKHFAVNNQEDNRYFVNAHVRERALREIYLKGFEIVVREADPMSLMTSYNLVNGIHAANQYDMLQSVLRDEWGYEGLVMTDWFTSQFLPDLQSKFAPIYPISSSTGCVKAGNDVQMPGCSRNVSDLVESASAGKPIDGIKVTKADLQHCAARVIHTVNRVLSRER